VKIINIAGWLSSNWAGEGYEGLVGAAPDRHCQISVTCLAGKQANIKIAVENV